MPWACFCPAFSNTSAAELGQGSWEPAQYFLPFLWASYLACFGWPNIVTENSCVLRGAKVKYTQLLLFVPEYMGDLTCFGISFWETEWLCAVNPHFCLAVNWRYPGIRVLLVLDRDKNTGFFCLFFILQIMGHDQLDSLHGENAFYLNEAVVRVSLSGLNRSDSSLVYEDGVYGLGISDLDMARTCENQVNLRVDTPCQPALTNELWKSTGPYQQMSFSCKSNKDAFNNGN